MGNQISESRKTLYRLGQIMTVIGVISFGSTFLTFALHFGDFSNFDANARSDALRAFGGMALMIAGGVIMGIGRQGVAGSGLNLDPEQAREDLKPWNRMAGQMMNDTISEIDVVNKVADRLASESGHEHDAGAGQVEAVTQEVIKVRCPGCHALNDEDAKFCKQCGKGL